MLCARKANLRHSRRILSTSYPEANLCLLARNIPGAVLAQFALVGVFAQPRDRKQSTPHKQWGDAKIFYAAIW